MYKFFLPLTTGSVDFSSGSTTMARVAEAVRTSYPMSMFAMVKPYSVPAPLPTDRQFGVLCLDASSTNLYFQRINLANSDLYNSVPAGDIVGLARSRNSTGSFKTTTGYFGVNQWGALSGSWATAATTPTIKVYRQGADETLGTDVNTTWPTQINETLIGRENISSGQTGRNFNGKISRVALWSVVLTDAEMGDLADGVSPLTIQLSNLVCYWPGSMITIAGVQYMEEVIQGKHAQMQNGALWTTEEPIYNQTAFKAFFASANVLI